MDDTAIAAPVAASEPRSTVLDGNASSPSGGGRPALSEEAQEQPRKPESVGDSLRAEAKRIAAEEAAPKTEEKPAKEEVKAEDAKPDAKAEVKPAKDQPDQKAAQSDDEQQPTKREPPKADAGERAEEGRERSPEGRRHHTPPARFLSQAKDSWRNVPNPVAQEVYRMMDDHQREVETYKAQVSEYEPLKTYAERAKASGTTLHQAMERYVNMEDAFRSDPANGFKALLHNLQMTPQQAVVALTRAYGVSPADLARHIQQSPDQYNALVQQQPGQRPQPHGQPQPAKEDPRVASLEARLAAMEQQSVVTSIVEPLIREIGHERYAELEDDIVMLLNSGKIPNTLSPSERLQEAYTLADRLNPASTRIARSDDQDVVPASERRVAQNLNGQLSVKSSLGGANDGDIVEPSGKSIRETLLAEARRIARR